MQRWPPRGHLAKRATQKVKGHACIGRSPSRNCNRNRYTVTTAHLAQLGATTKKRYSSLPPRISSILSGLSRSGRIGSVGFCKPQVGGSIPLASSTPTFGWADGSLSVYRIAPSDKHLQEDFFSNLQPRGFEGDVSPSWGVCEGAGLLRRRRRGLEACCRGQCSLPLSKNKDGLHGSLRVVVEIAILLKLIDKVN